MAMDAEVVPFMDDPVTGPPGLTYVAAGIETIRHALWWRSGAPSRCVKAVGLIEI